MKMKFMNSNDLNKFVAKIKILFDANFTKVSNVKHVHRFDGWTDLFWEKSPHVSKCHLKIIDNLEDRKLWLLHINIFPAAGYDLPILGCDIVAGPSKISGGFFDFSPMIDRKHHPMLMHFEEKTKDVSWKKPRELPDWATEIFSKNMVAVGNIRNEEVQQFMDVTYGLIEYYVKNMKQHAKPTILSTKDILNKYCINQKKNDKLHKSILAMGIPEDKKDQYVNQVLFEEI